MNRQRLADLSTKLIAFVNEKSKRNIIFPVKPYISDMN